MRGIRDGAGICVPPDDWLEKQACRQLLNLRSQGSVRLQSLKRQACGVAMVNGQTQSICTPNGHQSDLARPACRAPNEIAAAGPFLRTAAGPSAPPKLLTVQDSRLGEPRRGPYLHKHDRCYGGKCRPVSTVVFPHPQVWTCRVSRSRRSACEGRAQAPPRASAQRLHIAPDSRLRHASCLRAPPPNPISPTALAHQRLRTAPGQRLC